MLMLSWTKNLFEMFFVHLWYDATLGLPYYILGYIYKCKPFPRRPKNSLKYRLPVLPLTNFRVTFDLESDRSSDSSPEFLNFNVQSAADVFCYQNYSIVRSSTYITRWHKYLWLLWLLPSHAPKKCTIQHVSCTIEFLHGEKMCSCSVFFFFFDDA